GLALQVIDVPVAVRQEHRGRHGRAGLEAEVGRCDEHLATNPVALAARELDRGAVRALAAAGVTHEDDLLEVQAALELLEIALAALGVPLREKVEMVLDKLSPRSRSGVQRLPVLTVDAVRRDRDRREALRGEQLLGVLVAEVGRDLLEPRGARPVARVLTLGREAGRVTSVQE